MAILLKKVQLLERQHKIKEAIKVMKEVRLASFANDSFEIDEVANRLKAKKDLIKPKKKAKKKSDKIVKKK